MGEGSLWNYVRLLDGVTLASPSKYDKMICLVAAMRAVATITEASCLYLCQTKEFVRLHVRNLSSVFFWLASGNWHVFIQQSTKGPETQVALLSLSFWK